jgi:hypothetical protein
VWLSLFSLDVTAIRDLSIFAIAILTYAYARAQDPTPTTSPIQLTLSGHFEAPLGPAAVERGSKSVGEQIDAKRAADATRLQLSPIWDLAIWRYLPTDPAHTLNSRVASDDEPFFTPEYLKVTARQLDYELKKSEKASHELLR